MVLVVDIDVVIVLETSEVCEVIEEEACDDNDEVGLFVDVDTLDEVVDKDEVFGSVEAVKTVSDLFMPLKGEVVEFNEKL